MSSSCSPSFLALEEWSGCRQRVRTQLPALFQQQHPEAHSQAVADAAQAQTEHQDMPQSLELKGEQWESMRNQGPNKSHYFHQCCWTCSYPIGFGKPLCGIWSKHRLGGEGFFSTRVLVLKKAAVDELGIVVWEHDIGSKVLFGVQGFFHKISECFGSPGWAVDVICTESTASHSWGAAGQLSCLWFEAFLQAGMVNCRQK